MKQSSAEKILFDIIKDQVFIPRTKEKIVNPDGSEGLWIFDFRRVLLKPEILNAVCEVFWERFSSAAPFQVGGIEVAAIPLIAGLVMKSQERGTPVNGFFIRKSRKREGLMRMIEGEVTEEKIILVDDILNSGKSFIRQIEVIESLGKKVDTVFVLLRYRDLAQYSYFHDRGINIVSLFSLDDFSEDIPVTLLKEKQKKAVRQPFRSVWRFVPGSPNHHYVVPKSAPVLDAEKVYFGSDDGTFWALNQHDGSVAWKYRVRFGAHGKFIFSSPCIYKGTVFFGAYDGNFYALDTATGAVRFVYMDADWIGSSPVLDAKRGIVYIGLEFGLFTKRGGIVALNATTGEKKWERLVPGLVHSSPVFSEKYACVVFGCNDSIVRACDARDGSLLWEYAVGGEVKASLAIDEARGLVLFGSFDEKLYAINIKTGALAFQYVCEGAIYSTPVIHGDYVIVASLDKKVYAVHLDTGTLVWSFTTLGRIFATPLIVGAYCYIGSNDGRLYKLNVATGGEEGFAQVTERIVNKAAYSKTSKRFFVPTFANELYCLEENEKDTPSL